MIINNQQAWYLVSPIPTKRPAILLSVGHSLICLGFGRSNPSFYFSIRCLGLGIDEQAVSISYHGIFRIGYEKHDRLVYVNKIE